jgi:hypothetical protein
MITSRFEDILVGLVALVLAPVVLLRLVHGLRDGRLSLYRTQVSRAGNAAKFNFLLVLHALALVLMLTVAADLLFALGLRNAL